jgi:hypothetical protein
MIIIAIYTRSVMAIYYVADCGTVMVHRVQTVVSTIKPISVWEIP